MVQLFPEFLPGWCRGSEPGQAAAEPGFLFPAAAAAGEGAARGPVLNTVQAGSPLKLFRRLAPALKDPSVTYTSAYHTRHKCIQGNVFIRIGQGYMACLKLHQ